MHITGFPSSGILGSAYSERPASCAPVQTLKRGGPAGSSADEVVTATQCAYSDDCSFWLRLFWHPKIRIGFAGLLRDVALSRVDSKTVGLLADDRLATHLQRPLFFGCGFFKSGHSGSQPLIELAVILD